MTLSMLGFAANDTILKVFAGTHPLGQVIFLRALFAIVLVTLAAWWLGHLRKPSLAFHPLLVLRSVAEVIATVCFLTALFRIPLANVSAVMQALPLTVTLGALLWFREPVGWRRMSAILVGFAGVLVIIRPGVEGFSIYSIYALGAVAACTVRDLVTRRLPHDMPSMFITLATTIAVGMLGAGMSLFQTWQPVDVADLSLLALSSVALTVGYFFVVGAMRTGEIGFVSPFRYAVLLFSILGGLIFYSEIPDLPTVIGSAIVVATGIYTLYREHIVRRQNITPPPTRS